MKYAEVQKLIGDAVASPAVSAYSDGLHPRAGLVLGACRANDGENGWRLFVGVQSTDAVPAAQAAVAMADGHARVVEFGEIRARIAHGALQQRMDPLQAGAQINPAGKPWVGTLGLILRHGEDWFGVTNAHVVAPPGSADDRIMQAGRLIGSTQAASAIEIGRTLQADVAVVKLVSGIAAVPQFNAGLAGNIVGFRDMSPDDVGEAHVKTGRTTGSTRFLCDAIGMRGLRVAYDHGVATFDNACAFVAAPGHPPASQPGDSGSAIVRVSDRMVNALLHAGGPVGSVDWTFGLPFRSCLHSIGYGVLEVAR